MKLLICFICFFIAQLSVQGQNYLMSEASGMHIGLGGNITGGTILVSLIPGYTVKGRVTTELGISALLNDVGSNNLILTPTLSALIIKQNESFPFSLGASVGTQRVFRSRNDFRSIIFGPSLYHEISIDHVSIIPSVSYVFNSASNGFGSRNTISVPAFSAAIRLEYFYFEPTLVLNQGFNQFFLGLGYLFPSKKVEQPSLN